MNYCDDTIIDNVLYGLGVALDGKKYWHADCFAKFKAVLRKHLDKPYGTAMRVKP